MGFFEKLGEGLRKTRDSIFGSIAGLVNAGEITDELYDDLEEQLILADTGADVAMRLVEELRQEVRALLAEMHSLYAQGKTPKVKPTKACGACSLKELCLPKLMRSKSVSSYLRHAMEESP